ncbi:hypothetical protein MXB_5180 [Myxobolus squamalis]|nr:hypothetical protein MXB_5180 [Myxobolus squamalis]
MTNAAIKLTSIFLLSFIINFGINEVSGRISSNQMQKKLLAKPKHKTWASKLKMDEVPQGNSSRLQSQSLKNSHKSWGYVDSPETYGPNDWAKYYPNCGGSSQSPIRIVHNSQAQSKNWSTKLRFTIPARGDILQGELENNGHSVGININGHTTNIKITGGPLQEDQYSLQQLHFHLSCNKQSSGSEHKKWLHTYHGEAHFVFKRHNYRSYESAVKNSGGVVVLAFFIQIGNQGNKGIKYINKFIKTIHEPRTKYKFFIKDTSVNVGDGLSIYDFIGHGWEQEFHFAYYLGSFTTPPCDESVKWIVVNKPLIVSWADMQPWTKLKGAHISLLCNNNRPVQDLNQREIYFG